jgi:GNAT superfamily N-acetyltransferase
MEWRQENFIISTDKNKLDVPYIHQFLSNESYWAEGIPFDIVKKSIENSLCLGIYDGKKQIGFARIITDEATFGYLADVFVDTAYRGRGLSKWLMQIITNLPFMPLLRRFMLATKDAHKLYEQFGFTPLTLPERFMQLHHPNVYAVKTKELEGKENMQNL